MPARHPSKLPLDTWKTKISSPKLARNCLHKCSPRWIETICDSFKDHTAFPSMQMGNSSKPKACNRCYQASQEILSLHAIDATKHPKKSSHCILGKDSGCVFFIWLMQICWIKHCHNWPTKLEDTNYRCRIGHA
jgi:hypothetical protein